ncbi:hypothetical protein E3T24_04735 [Cryobacterium sp. TmT2-59]|uniref:hypothetical protein n=1 Tax=Cryobacterium sp. TmT2-59 TaxID=1259264 RepID=UPI00106A4F24|nr:hypothetical protein [Cryobacterium sp. TmT2-59]TFC87501.1 hypothetical protein E3T24_04735 [Cryobacterium sp. TmT2-59]
MDLTELKATYRRLTDPTADWHHTEAEVLAARAAIAVGDPAWLAAYDAELEAWEADVDASAAE